MALRLPPGVPFLFRGIILLAAPPVFILSLHSFLSRRFLLTIPTWIAILAAALSTPVIIVLNPWLKYWRVRRAAARLGAVLPPKWEGKSIGNIDLLRLFMDIFLNGYPGDHFLDKIDELGPTFQVNLLGATEYITCDPEVIKLVLATDFNNYVKGDYFYNLMHSVLGTGVFNSDGERWKFHRSMTRPFFSKDRISHFELFDRHAEAAIAKMKERFREGYAIDFQDLIARFTLDSATEFLFGHCVHSIESPLPYAHNIAAPHFVTKSQTSEFAAAFSEALQALSMRGRLGWMWPLFEIFQTRTGKYMKVVDALLDPILQDALRKKEAREKEMAGREEKAEDEDDTMLDHLVKFTSDPVILHDEVLNILLAGRDTTAASLTFAVYFLSMYPHVLERLRAEILEKVGPTNRPTYEDIREMKYLRAVINETLRLYPAVPFNIRFAVKESTLPNPDPNGKPFYVPPKTPISYSVLQMHRRTEYWGPDATEFDPDRFLDERVRKYLTPNPFIFLPFNAGPRICLGQQFAYNEISFFLIRLLQNFSSITLDPDSHTPGTLPPKEWAGARGRKGVERFWPKVHLTMYSHGGLWMKMDEAKDDA